MFLPASDKSGEGCVYSLSAVHDKLILCGRYIKRILGDEDSERFNRGGRWKRGRGRGKWQLQRGGYHVANCREDSSWGNKRGGRRRYTDKRGRNSGPTTDRRRQTESESTDLSSGSTPESQIDEKKPATNGEVDSLDECDLQEEMGLQKGIIDAIMVDVASVVVAASSSPPNQQGTSNDCKQEVSSKDENLVLTNSCDNQPPHTSRTVGRKRKRVEGGWNRRDAKRKKKKASYYLGNVLP